MEKPKLRVLMTPPDDFAEPHGLPTNQELSHHEMNRGAQGGPADNREREKDGDGGSDQKHYDRGASSPSPCLRIPNLDSSALQIAAADSVAACRLLSQKLSFRESWREPRSSC